MLHDQEVNLHCRSTSGRGLILQKIQNTSDDAVSFGPVVKAGVISTTLQVASLHECSTVNVEMLQHFSGKMETHDRHVYTGDRSIEGQAGSTYE